MKEKDTSITEQKIFVEDTSEVVRKDSSKVLKKKPRSAKVSIFRDTIKPDTTKDSISSTPITQDTIDTFELEKKENGCGNDSTPLWVYPEPSGGLHYRSLEIKFVANRKATIHYRFDKDTLWREYSEKLPLLINSTTTLVYDAIDSCGNIMETRKEYYEIETSLKESPCDSDMVFVKVNRMEFCIDKYEWPNKKDKKPLSYISFYQAMDSCFSVGKRLCSTDEWFVACSGPYTWKYPYGNLYEKYACVTHDTTVRNSGSKVECRSFFGAFDMSGNLLEWTNTKSKENSYFPYVMGGFWESGPKSGCGDRRYSYYPQNRHNPVGFRCCKTLEQSKGIKGEMR
ncbi:MAG: formylglycine-generating enzyme family protein [Chitinispirillaceae bacterium]|nr:formylglycine-generating enzyme family protein [Chitinispirillaceae bacterium]